MIGDLEKDILQNMIDYDPCVNAGSWQWSASTGCDAQPYFRVFNPWLQQKKFDPECVYIKKWIPELVNLTTKQIHDIETKPLDSSIDYPRPMVIHKEESARSKLMFKVV